MEQPCESVQKGEEQKFYKLKKTLYELKQTMRAWYSRIGAYFMKGLAKCDYEHILFLKEKQIVKF